jgi:hypothetical protein
MTDATACVSLLLGLKVPPHSVQAIVGHANLDVTMTIYAHTSLEEKLEALRARLHRPAHLALCRVGLLWIKGAPSARTPGLRAAPGRRPRRAQRAGRFLIHAIPTANDRRAWRLIPG